jgi:hypothetical protein
MSRVTISQASEAVAAFEVVGRWWTADRPEEVVGGLLEYDPTTGCSLQLAGALNSPDFPEVGGPVPTTTILGIDIKGQHHTLADATQGDGSFLMGTPVMQTWHAYELFVGAHFPRGKDTFFDTASVVLENLDHWAAQGHPRVMSLNSLLSAQVDLPLPLTSELTNGRLTLLWQDSSHTGVLEARIHVNPMFTYTPKEPVNEKTLWEDLISPMIYFMTLATGCPSAVRTRTVTSGGLSASVLMSRWAAVGHDSANRAWEHLIYLEEIRGDFDRVMHDWFDLFPKLRLPIIEFFAATFDTDMVLEEVFTRVTRTIEIWQRTRCGGTYMPEQDFLNMLDTIKGALTGEAWKLAKMRLNYGNEPTAKQRVDSMIQSSFPELRELVGSYTKFSRRVIDTRNRLTHGPENPPQGYTDYGEMFWAQKTLDAIFTSAMLDAISIPTEQISRMMGRTSAWRSLSSRYNMLSPSQPSRHPSTD